MSFFIVIKNQLIFPFAKILVNNHIKKVSSLSAKDFFCCSQTKFRLIDDKNFFFMDHVE